MSSPTRAITRTVLLALVTLLGACGDDPTQPIEGGGDPENISRVTVTLTPAGGTAISTSRLDPDGTQLPLPVGAASATLTLRRGVTYTGAITLLNDLDAAHIIDITDEVEAEGNFHRFFYSLTCGGVTVPVASLNLDTQNPPRPLGTTFQLVVAADAPLTASCALNIQLHHFENDKGDGTGTVFDTDLNIDFPVAVQQ